MRFDRAFAVSSIFALLLPQLVGAATFAVDDVADAVDAAPGDGICASAAGTCTLRAAVMEANALYGADEIDLPAGTFALSIPAAAETSANAAATGDLDMTDGDSGDFAPALAIHGAGMDATVIDAQGIDRVLEVWYPATTLALADLELRGGAASLGAGIYFWSDSIDLAMDRVRLRGNAGDALFGFPVSGTVALGSLDITGNGGAGIGIGEAYVSVHDTTIEGNAGPGIRVGNDMFFDLVDSTIRANHGGGIVAASAYADVYVSGSAIVGNDGADAGAISASGDPAVVNVERSTLSGNRGTDAGAVRVVASSFAGVVLSDCTVTNNTATLAGGAISIQNASIASGALVTLGDTIVAGNHSLVATECSVTGSGVWIRSRGYNLFGTGCIGGVLSSGDLIGSPGVPIDPRLAPLGDYGGPTATHALLAGSPAIDAGSPEALGSSMTACATTDQRGVPKSGDGNGDGVIRCDIGAYELRGSCSDGIDNDGDGAIDLADPGCGSPLGQEAPLCQNGLDDDHDGGIDFDGGAAANGGVALGPPDPQCVGHPTRNSEIPKGGCGFGAELVPGVAILRALARRTRRSSRRA